MMVRVCILLFISVYFVLSSRAQPPAGDTTPKPTLISAPEPFYPKEIKDAGIGGRVTVRVVVDASGAIVSVDNPTGPAEICGEGENDPRLVALRNSMVDAIKQAKFEPAMKDGRPVKSVAYVGSTFDPVDDKTPDERPTAIQIIRSNAVTGKAVSMPRPLYPGPARSARASGPVSVRIVLDEKGDVFTAEAISGHPLLRNAAEKAACRAKFSPTSAGGKAVRVLGVVTYNFAP